jgi:hypothetical protein
MPDPSTTPSARSGPWRILILDRDPADPKWLLATVADPGDVRPAGPGGTPGEMTTAWVSTRYGLAVVLTPLSGALAWSVDEPGQ